MSRGASAIDDQAVGVGGQQGRQLQQLIRSGRSFSGREKNCFFLNTGQANQEQRRFANLSAASGLDLTDDARAIAVSDWDHDGDLDLWVANRSGPQLRYLTNTLPAELRNFLSIKLQGTRCNRDAVGARVTLFLRGAPQQITRSLKAGSGYLSQSSKQLHFGLNNADGIKELKVTWPNGTVQSFKDLQANCCYLIQQDNPKAEIQQSPPEGSPTKVFSDAGPHQPTRVIDNLQNNATLLSAPLPLPSNLAYLDWDTGETTNILHSESPEQLTLINLWAPWCGPCLNELKEFSTQADNIQKAGINIVAICVDEKKTNHPSLPISSENPNLRFGWSTSQLLNQLQLFHDNVFDLHTTLPLPCSFLVDAQSNLVGFFRGPVGASELIKHSTHLAKNEKSRRDASVPFSGRWSADPKPRRLLTTALSLLEIADIKTIIAYVQKHQTALRTDSEFHILLFNLAQQFSAHSDHNRAEKLYLATLDRQPELAPAHFNLGVLYAQKNSYAKAIKSFRRVVRLRPNDQLARFYLGTTLARTGDVTQAASELSKIDEWQSLHPAQQFEAAIIFALLGNVSQAENLYKTAVLHSANSDLNDRYRMQLMAALRLTLQDAEADGQTERASQLKNSLKQLQTADPPN